MTTKVKPHQPKLFYRINLDLDVCPRCESKVTLPCECLVFTHTYHCACGMAWLIEDGRIEFQEDLSVS